jgi:Tat protein secretion system quality control protein TatD with DNase activity
LEKDALHLTPMSHRDKPNEPAFVRRTAEYVAREVFGIVEEVLAAAATANARGGWV